MLLLYCMYKDDLPASLILSLASSFAVYSKPVKPVRSSTNHPCTGWRKLAVALFPGSYPPMESWVAPGRSNARVVACEHVLIPSLIPSSHMPRERGCGIWV